MRGALRVTTCPWNQVLVMSNNHEYNTRRAALTEGLKADRHAVNANLGPLVVRAMVTAHFCDGVPVTAQQVGGVVESACRDDRGLASLRKQAEAEVILIEQKLWKETREES